MQDNWPAGKGGGRPHKFCRAKIVIGYKGWNLFTGGLKTTALWGQSDNGSGRDGVGPL